VGAVADGHGASPYFRSDKGSGYAVNCAIKNLKQFCKKMFELKQKSPKEYNKFLSNLENEDKKAELAKTVFVKIHTDWKKSVLGDIQRHPFDVKEYEELPQEYIEAYTGGNMDYYRAAYGTTLVCFAVCVDFFMTFRLGDGCCISIYNDKMTCEIMPSEPYKNMLRQTTRSMCNLDAVDKFGYYIGREIPKSVFAVTDGIVNSFDGDKAFYSYIEKTDKYMRKGKTEKNLPELKKRIYTLSEENSGDDVSMAAVLL
jgi:hypothetical protein